MFRISRFSATFPIGCILFICLCAGVLDMKAQKRKPTKRSVSVKELSDICVPPRSEYLSVLQIDSNAKATLTVQTNQGSKVLFDANLSPSPNDVLTAVFSKSTVTVRADPSLRFDLVVKILKGARQALNTCFNVEASTRIEDPYVYIYPEPREKTNLPVYPNPLLLIVHLDKNSEITLNNEKKGSLHDTTTLRNTLKQVFKEREDNGVLRAGTNVVEKTVRVNAEPSARFSDVIKIVDALKEAGATPVGLQIDDNHDDYVVNPFEIEKPYQ